MTQATFTIMMKHQRLLISYLHKQLFQISIYKTHLSSSELGNITFSQANTGKISWTSSKSHLINAFSLTLAEYSQPLPVSSLLDDSTCSCLTKVSHSCCTTSTWLSEIYITNCFTRSEPG